MSHDWHPEIPGWSHDILPFYARVAQELPDPCVCVEVGVYRGRSVMFLADTLRSLGKRASILAVDLWDGSDVASHRPNQETLRSFVEDLDRLRLYGSVSVCPCASADAARETSDASCDLVFIDANHDYEHVLADIKAWWRKVKPGGILAGHDHCATTPGVERAVREVFGSVYHVDDTCWSVRRCWPISTLVGEAMTYSRTKVIKTRFSEDEKLMVVYLAGKRGVSSGTLIRSLVREALRKEASELPIGYGAELLKQMGLER